MTVLYSTNRCLGMCTKSQTCTLYHGISNYKANSRLHEYYYLLKYIRAQV